MRFTDEKRLTELRKCLGETVKSVWENKRPVLIKSHKEPLAAIVPLHMLDMIKAQKEKEAEEALRNYFEDDSDSTPKVGFEQIKGNSETRHSDELEYEINELKVEQSAEYFELSYWKLKCLELQNENKLLKAQQFPLENVEAFPLVKVDTSKAVPNRVGKKIYAATTEKAAEAAKQHIKSGSTKDNIEIVTIVVGKDEDNESYINQYVRWYEDIHHKVETITSTTEGKKTAK